MTYRGVYRDGLVRLEGDVSLRNGSYVEVNPILGPSARMRVTSAPRSGSSGRRGASMWAAVTARKMTKAQRMAALMAARGAWKDRPDWKGRSSASIAAALRRRAAGRGRNG